MTTLPWALIPVVLVPTFLIGHALVFAHMRAAVRAGNAGHGAGGNLASRKLFNWKGAGDYPPSNEHACWVS
jgi:hypothetical protein